MSNASNVSQNPLIEELRANWKMQEKKDEIQNQKWENCADIKVPDQTLCGGKRLEVYKLKKIPVQYGMVTTAYYCPAENRYWIKEEGGDYTYQCRILGPFHLDRKNE